MPLNLSKVRAWFGPGFFQWQHSPCWYFCRCGSCCPCAVRDPVQEGRELPPWRGRLFLHLPWLRKHPRNSEGLFSWHCHQRKELSWHILQTSGYFKHLNNEISNHGFQPGKALEPRCPCKCGWEPEGQHGQSTRGFQPGQLSSARSNHQI